MRINLSYFDNLIFTIFILVDKKLALEITLDNKEDK